MKQSSQKATKIVATLGPASDSPEMIQQLIEAGVNVFRFNMKHADIAWHQERINLVQSIADRLQYSVGILIDLQGPEIRIETPNKQPVSAIKDVPLFFSPILHENRQMIHVPHPEVFLALKPGNHFSIDDGFIEFEVVSLADGGFFAKPFDSADIKHRKGLNLVGIDVDLPSLIEDDLLKLDLAARNKVDFVALSFCRSKEDIAILRSEMDKRSIDAMIVAKIESQKALDNLDKIIEATDVVMVARGDLGIEVPIEQLAYWQKKMISLCRTHAKPVITATQMLESMIFQPRPTRAEATDVANAVLDGTDAVMLSGESANGKYPAKAVSFLSTIAQFNEPHTHVSLPQIQPPSLTSAVVNSAMSLLETMGEAIEAIVVCTETGSTARMISSYRPNVRILAATDRQKTVETLTMSYGVHAECMEFPHASYTDSSFVLQTLSERGLVQSGQQVIVIHGDRWMESGLTNAVAVEKVK
ncbi:MAG: pyruvate kinase [Candidatus Pacebacteria bacterium RIFOXYB1_FULL_44_10]|nr:MAG: pyruvate kinase [Candidatus Pacebacteria bacterium RIFOXYB1_FULL_44_10]